MSGHDYRRLSTDALVQQFVETAQAAGNVFALDFKKLKELNEDNVLEALAAFQAKQTDARMEEMQALGAELRRRKPVAECQSLFGHDDRDVRGWAQAQLHSVDPECADAALWSLSYDLTTQEILAWRRRILQRSVRHPALRDMTVAQLVDYFVDACERCYGSTRFLTEKEGGWPTMKVYNEISGDIYGSARELNRRNELLALLQLFDHPLITVQQRAAGYCIPVAAARAIAKLEEVAATCDCVERGDASQTLHYWRTGQYCAFPDDLQDVRV